MQSIATKYRRTIPLASTFLGNLRRRHAAKVIVFHFRFPMNLVVCRDLIRRLVNDGRLAVWVCMQCDTDQTSEAIRRLLRQSIGPLPVVDADLLYALKFDLLISPIWELAFHHLPRLRQFERIRRRLGLGTFKSVQLFHGLAEKKGAGIGNMELAEPFDYLFLLNRRAQRHYERLGMPAERTRLVGFCKLDALARRAVDTTSLRKQLGCGNAPVVLYAPTWEFVNERRELLEGVIQKLAQVPAMAVVKLHDLTYEHFRGSGFLEHLERQYPTVRLLRETDSSVCLALADMLVSDMSSIAYEYLVLDRPIAFVETPEMIERFGTEGIEYEMRWCGDIVRDLDELPRIVERCLNHPSAKADARRQVAEEVLYQPGTAVDRAVAELYRLLETGPNGAVLAR